MDSSYLPHRRDLLKTASAVVLGASVMGAQQPATSMPPPKKARITSSIMIGILKGAMEEKMRKVAEVGI